MRIIIHRWPDPSTPPPVLSKESTGAALGMTGVVGFASLRMTAIEIVTLRLLRFYSLRHCSGHAGQVDSTPNVVYAEA